MKAGAHGYIEGKIFIKDAKVGREETRLDFSALYAIFSKLTLDLTEGNWELSVEFAELYACSFFCGCQVCREVSEGNRELGEGAKDNGGVRKSGGPGRCEEHRVRGENRWGGCE